jgi:outer membrane protein assembly factor BamB
MRCPNPICREVFEVREDKQTPEKPPEVYRLEGEPPPVAPPSSPPKPIKPSKTGSVSDVVPLLEAFASGRPEPTAPPQGKSAPTNGDLATPPPQRVASWRDEPPARRTNDPAESPVGPGSGETKKSNGPEEKANTGASSDSTKSPAPPLPPPPEEETAPALASDYLPPDAEPSQRELDSLETTSPPRSRKALFAALTMLALVFFIIVGVAAVFIQTFVRAETRASAETDKDFADSRYGAAAAGYASLVKTFPKSDQLSRYEFLLALSKIGEEANSGLQTNPEADFAKFKSFLEKHRDAPLLKENHKHVGSILRKMAENLGEFAETKSTTEPIAVGHEALDSSTKYTPNDPDAKSLAEKLDQTKAKIVLDQKRGNFIDALNGLQASGGGAAELKRVRAAIRMEKLEADPDIVAKLKEIEKALRDRIVYVEAKDTPPATLSDPVEPSMLVTPFTSGSPRPKAGSKRVVVALDRGVLYALDEANGAVLWATRVGIDTTALPKRLPATAQSAEMFLVLSADRNTLMALAAADGSVAWRHNLSAPCLGRVVVDRQRAYVPTYDGRVNEIEINGGVLLGYFELDERLSLGAVLQEGTDCLYVPGDSDNVFVLDLARTQEPGKPPRKKSCIAILNTGHPSGSLRSEPLVLNRVDPRHLPPGGAPAPGYLVLCQTDGFEHMKLRVFSLPIDAADAPSVQPDKRVRGWSWFEPRHDPEKFAFVTDAGNVGLFGINQFGNDDQAVFALNRDDIRLGGANPHLVRGQVVYVLDNDFWIVGGGVLQRYYFDMFGQGQQLVQSPDWPKAGVPTGSPLHAGQMDEINHVLVTVSRDLARQITLATAVDSRNGKLLWQRQLGIDSQGDPVALGGDALVVDRNGAVLLIEGSRVRSGSGPEWQVGENHLADPIEGLVPGSVQIIQENPGTVHEIAIVSQANNAGYKLLVRTIRSEAAGQKPSVQTSTVDITALPQGTAAVVNGALIVPLADGLHLFKLPLAAGAGGPDWRSSNADEDAQGHVVALKDDEFLTTDGSRGITRRVWPASGNFQNKSSRDMPARIVAAPLVLPGSKVCVADAQGVVSLLNGATLTTEKSWKMQGKSISGFFVCKGAICVIVDRKKLICIDPAKDAILWQYETPDSEIVGQPSRIGDMVVVASSRGRFVGLDSSSGLPRGLGYVLNASAAPTGTPVAAGLETALVPLTDGTVFFLSLQLLQDRQATTKR